MTMRGIQCKIIRSSRHSPTGGITSKVDRVTFVGPDIPAESLVTDNAPAVVLKEMTDGKIVAAPIDPPPDGRASYMDTGAYIMTTTNGTLSLFD
jgi:hypothetical protein